MKRATLLILLILITFDLRAQQTDCRNFIESMQNQEQAFLNLHFELPDEQCRGKQLATDIHGNSDANISSFEQLPKENAKDNACRVSAWKEFVRYSASQIPFDMESGAAGTIAKRIVGDKKNEAEFLKAYNDAIGAIAHERTKDPRAQQDMWCRGKALNAIVCHNLEKLGVKKGLRCNAALTTKSYSSCMKTKSVAVKCEGDQAANGGCSDSLKRNTMAILRACETTDSQHGTATAYEPITY